MVLGELPVEGEVGALFVGNLVKLRHELRLDVVDAVGDDCVFIAVSQPVPSIVVAAPAIVEVIIVGAGVGQESVSDKTMAA